MREWSAKVFMVDDQGNEHPADCFNKVVYNLHPSFEQPVQSSCPPPPFARNRTDPASLHEAPLHLPERGLGRV